jgi:dTDP-4-dehydrorhamnose reductase
VYGTTKRDGEIGISEANCDFTIIRTSWLYSSFGANFVKTILRLSSERSELNIVADQIGSPTYCRDLANLILSHLDYFLNHPKEIYHFSNEGTASWYDFAHAIAQLKNKSCTIRPIPTLEYPTPAKRPVFSLLNKSKLKSRLEITIPHWRESLAKCLQEL